MTMSKPDTNRYGHRNGPKLLSMNYMTCTVTMDLIRVWFNRYPSNFQRQIPSNVSPDYTTLLQSSITNFHKWECFLQKGRCTWIIYQNNMTPCQLTSHLAVWHVFFYMPITLYQNHFKLSLPSHKPNSRDIIHYTVLGQGSILSNNSFQKTWKVKICQMESFSSTL